MERICERRVVEGLPGLAIQWSAIGDVGVLGNIEEANTELAFGGTLRQSISSCLRKLEVFLLQNEAIVSTMVLPEKNFGRAASLDILETILLIMGNADENYRLIISSFV